MRRRCTALAAVLCLLAAGCGTNGDEDATESTPTTTPTLIPRPLVERELPELLLNPEQVNAAMGTTEMAVISSQTQMGDHSATMTPQECLAIDGAAEAPVYADSGYRAMRDQSLNNGDRFTHYVKQAVVLFPLVETAAAFLDASVDQWPECHEYRHTQSGTHWIVGEITNENNILSTVSTQQEAGTPGWACGRALALRNNIIIDVNTCSADPADTAVRIADQIGTNVTERW